jgi:hypothetical protein
LPLALSACLTGVTPRPGQPVEASGARGAVCGHIAIRSGTRDVPPLNPGADWASVGPRIYAELRISLLGLAPRRTSTPSVAGDGLFCWHLPAGDYLLIGSPADDVSAPVVAQRHWPLAAFRVAPRPDVACVGDLRIETEGVVAIEDVPRMEFGIAGVDIVDACIERLREVEVRFAPLVMAPRTQLMVDAADLSFEDPGLFDAVRVRLDAAAAPSVEPVHEPQAR